MLDQQNTTPHNKQLDLVDEAETFYPIPQQLNVVHWVCIGIMYTFLAFLVGFLIYISITWNKVRINEYT